MSLKINGLDIENPRPNLIAIDLGSLSNPFFVLVPNDKKPLSWARRPVINFIHLLYTEHLSCTLTLRTLRLSSYIHIYMYRAPLGQCHNWRKPIECSYCIFSTVRVWGVTRCICFDIPGQIHLSVLFRVPMS